MKSLWRVLKTIIALLVFIALPAQAHVKWFVDYDLTKAPMPIGQVLTGTFVQFLLASVCVVYVFFLVDRLMYKKAVLYAFDQRLKMFDEFSGHIMRVSAALFFFALLAWKIKFGTGFYLTPELHTTLVFVPWIHLILGLCALWRRASPITGAGILVLYVMAAYQYGVFHLLDYVIFPGIGYFFLVFNNPSKQWKKSGFIVLYASTGLTYVWAAVEKFAYPQWSYPLLQHNPDMLMGLDPHTYMILAGFVEFTITFTLLGAASVVGRLGSLGLLSVFVLAIAKFGLIDAVGHLMFIAILFVLIVRGPTDAREMLVLREKTIWTEAYFMTGLYFLALNVMFILYYGLHYIAYGVS